MQIVMQARLSCIKAQDWMRGDCQDLWCLLNTCLHSKASRHAFWSCRAVAQPKSVQKVQMPEPTLSHLSAFMQHRVGRSNYACASGLLFQVKMGYSVWKAHKGRPDLAQATTSYVLYVQGIVRANTSLLSRVCCGVCHSDLQVSCECEMMRSPELTWAECDRGAC